MEKCEEPFTSLKTAGIRVKLDDRDNVSPGWKFNEWELKGVPLRIEIGPRDVENGVAACARRDTNEKFTLPLDDLAQKVHEVLEDIQQNMYASADQFKLEHTKDVFGMEELTQQVSCGYARAMWCGERACEDVIKEETGATSRNMPFDQSPIGHTCVCCGKKASKVMYFAKAY
jgi:prolyl-tRNA synthetase